MLKILITEEKMKKILSILVICVLAITLTGCNDDKPKEENQVTEPSGDSGVKIKTVDDFVESQGLVKYFTIEDKRFSIPETVGEYANYLSQLGNVTLNDTGNSVEDEELSANGISSMVAYLNVETKDGEEQRFLLRYKNPTDKKISVAEATVTQIEIKYDSLSDQDYEKVFKGIEVITNEYTFVMDGKTGFKKFWNELGDPIHETDGRLEYNDSLGYTYIFDCCNENRNGIFRGFIIKYPTNTEQ